MTEPSVIVFMFVTCVFMALTTSRFRSLERRIDAIVNRIDDGSKP